MKKKLILLFSCLFLFTSIFAFPASAAGDEGFTIDFETNCNAIFMKKSLNDRHAGFSKKRG